MSRVWSTSTPSRERDALEEPGRGLAIVVVLLLAAVMLASGIGAAYAAAGAEASEATRLSFARIACLLSAVWLVRAVGKRAPWRRLGRLVRRG